MSNFSLNRFKMKFPKTVDFTRHKIFIYFNTEVLLYVEGWPRYVYRYFRN